MIERLTNDPAFAAVDFEQTLDARRFVGRAPEQVDAFLAGVIEPIRRRYADDLNQGPDEVRV